MSFVITLVRVLHGTVIPLHVCAFHCNGFWQMHTMMGVHKHIIRLCPHRVVWLILFLIHTFFADCVPDDPTSSGGHDTGSVVGGILSLVIILISGVAALVIILLILRIRTLNSTQQ